jgi:hypothetical protein
MWGCACSSRQRSRRNGGRERYSRRRRSLSVRSTPSRVARPTSCTCSQIYRRPETPNIGVAVPSGILRFGCSTSLQRAPAESAASVHAKRVQRFSFKSNNWSFLMPDEKSNRSTGCPSKRLRGGSILAPGRIHDAGAGPPAWHPPEPTVTGCHSATEAFRRQLPRSTACLAVGPDVPVCDSWVRT